jgi:hypothetical protein
MTVTPPGGVFISFPLPPSTPSYAQWQSYFLQCQPVLGYRPLNSGGDTVSGPFLMAPNAPFSPGVTTVAQLVAPSSANVGWLFVVTDALSPTWGTQLTGGGTTVCLAMSNGVQWVAA